ncbi:MAG: class B sortase [Lachnospiraceae bacterium]|nr:class B sortase [Lachnospiraceae bacterium]
MKLFKKLLIRILIIVAVGILVFSIIKMISLQSETEQVNNMYQALSAQVQAPPDTSGSQDLEESDATVGSDSTFAPDAAVSPDAAEDSPALNILPQYTDLVAQNGDMVGWISITDTRIDYPVMTCEDDTEFYLSHDFYKNSDRHGVPFIDSSCCNILDSDNLIIYGHNMHDGTMFADLNKYTDVEFCKNHPYITFNTIYAEYTYHIVMVFKIEESDTTKFPYHTITQFDNSSVTVNDYIARAKYYSIWSDEQKISDDDKLLTLSTCEYTLTNGRLVIIAKRL